MRVDAHLHVWRAAEAEAPGVQTIVPPQTDVPIELASETMLENQINRAVLVQPVFRGEDNSYVAQCARAEPARFAAVCVVDPRVPNADERLTHWIGQGCRGLRLRPRIATEAAVFGDPSTYPLWELAQRQGIVVSVLASPEHAAAIGELAERFPGVPILIDHMGHPAVAEGAGGQGFQDLLRLAKYPRMFIKASGFYHFSRERFPYADCWDLIRAVHDRFGPQRLVWGSDFPHVLLASGYRRSMALPEQALGAWSADDRDLIMGINASKLYWPGP
ncbi:MAG: amidohydrolase family protein [Planctomycetia bacterium]|nr:amidohydrolase family protein [Planctomycetia bacterium]